MKFKSGDWVRDTRSNHIFQVSAENFNMNSNSAVYELWQPKEGEHILATDGAKVYLVRFLGMNYEKFVCTHLDGFSEAFIKVQPFIGTLPSFIKDI